MPRGGRRQKDLEGCKTDPHVFSVPLIFLNVLIIVWAIAFG